MDFKSLTRQIANVIIFALAIGMNFPILSHADEVSLLVWLEDSGNYTQKALPRSQFQTALKRWEENGVGLIRAIFIENGQSQELSQELNHTLQASDKITNLIIATHGSTDLRKNIVLLDKLGEFGPKGTTGLLRELFKQIAPYLTDHLNISMQACATSCGTKDQIKVRVNGLRNELLEYGVRRLSIWGARQPLAFDSNWNAISNKQAVAQIKSLLGSIVGGSLLVGTVTGMLSFMAISDFSFDLESFKSALKISMASTGASTGLLYGLIYLFVKDTDKKGFLTISDGEQTRVLDVESGALDSIHVTNSRCGYLLQSQP